MASFVSSERGDLISSPSAKETHLGVLGVSGSCGGPVADPDRSCRFLRKFWSDRWWLEMAWASWIIKIQADDQPLCICSHPIWESCVGRIAPRPRAVVAPQEFVAPLAADVPDWLFPPPSLQTYFCGVIHCFPWSLNVNTSLLRQALVPCESWKMLAFAGGFTDSIESLLGGKHVRWRTL